MTDSHPARSPEFLSRFYDGELAPLEAADFQAHRETCGECRAAVAELARALSAYRASPAAEPPSDLSARILRKIRAQSPSRRPFGVSFGIDVRWAGVFAAALIVTILATSLVSERRAIAPRIAPVTSGTTAHLVEEPALPPTEASQVGGAGPEARRAEPGPPTDAAAQKVREKQAPAGQVARERASSPARPAPAAPSDEARTEADKTEELPAAKAQAKTDSPSPRPNATAAQIAGAEAGAMGAMEKESEMAAARLVIRSADGRADTPALASPVAKDRLSSLRGREFVLDVSSEGRVLSVEPQEAAPLRKDRSASAAPVAADLEALRELRFVPGDQPRRLAVKIE